MKLTDKLLPCPFCGCTKVPKRQGNGIGDYWLECFDCGASTRLREDGAGNEKDWNRRPDATSAAAAPVVHRAAEQEQQPYLYVYEFDTPFGVHRDIRYGPYNGRYPDRTVALYAAPLPRASDASAPAEKPVPAILSAASQMLMSNGIAQVNAAGQMLTRAEVAKRLESMAWSIRMAAHEPKEGVPPAGNPAPAQPDERAAFEDAMRATLTTLLGPHCMARSPKLDGQYAHTETEYAWRTWQIARAASPQPAALVVHIDDFGPVPRDPVDATSCIQQAVDAAAHAAERERAMAFDTWFHGEVVAGRLYPADEEAARAAWLARPATPQADQREPIAWESTTPAYRKYITDSTYQRFSAEVRKWYKPYRCAACATSAQAGQRPNDAPRATPYHWRDTGPLETGGDHADQA